MSPIIEVHNKGRKRQCLRCLEWKDKITHFDKNPEGTSGFLECCRSCISQLEKSQIRTYHFYGITIKQHRQMIIDQNGCCAICRRSTNRLIIDHCHETGKVRGLLCYACNSAIGLLQEDPRTFFSAMEYLNKSR